MQNEKLNRNSLVEQIQDILVERILSGRYASGERIKELKIAEELGTSQAPVREALRSLQAQGYLERQPYAGSRVRTFSRKDLIEVYQAREALETYAIRLCYDRLKEKVDDLDRILAAMKQAGIDNDRVAYSEHNTNFHRLILETTGNHTLCSLWDSLSIKSRVIHTMYGTSLSSQKAADLHPSIVEAIRKGDQDECVRQLTKHYEVIREYHVRAAEKA